MKQKSMDGKITIEVEDIYLSGSDYRREDKTAIIKLFAEESSVSLYEVANAIIDCTFHGRGSVGTIDSERFSKLDIYLKIKKSEDACVTYNFKIPIYQSTREILPAIACNIRI